NSFQRLASRCLSAAFLLLTRSPLGPGASDLIQKTCATVRNPRSLQKRVICNESGLPLQRAGTIDSERVTLEWSPCRAGAATPSFLCPVRVRGDLTQARSFGS